VHWTDNNGPNSNKRRGLDLLWMAGREAVAEAGALAGPRGWSRDVAHLEKL